MYPALVFTILYYLIAFVVNIGAKSFDVEAHSKLVWEVWEANRRLGGPAPSIDVFLPVRGEPLAVLRNTWTGVRAAAEFYRDHGGTGTQVRVFVADDGGSAEVAEMAESDFFRLAGFRYFTRPVEPEDKTANFRSYNQGREEDGTVDLFGISPADRRGVKKKAGNLKSAMTVASAASDVKPGEICAVFDADFVPAPEYFAEMVPYMVADPRLGIIQSPQYFQIVRGEQNWLERGAGVVQELFYRFIQQSRDQLDGAICVGTNALYRRAALMENGGGPTQADHSEDVRTGFRLRYGCPTAWGLRYIPIALATGVCPSRRGPFAGQQYRWCRGSLDLLFSREFWRAVMSRLRRGEKGGYLRRKLRGFRTRCCYLSGFCYYLHTAAFTFVGPIIPLVLLTAFPDQVRLVNYGLIVPSLVYNLVVFPLWHRSRYGLEAWAVKLIYGWAHFFAITDKIRGRQLGWQATGAGAKTGDKRIEHVGLRIGVWGFITGLPWVGLSIWYMFTRDALDFAPNLASGLFYLLIVCIAISPTREPKGSRKKRSGMRHRRYT
jgi:cellulose synthase (UDP-forming)